MLPRGRLTKLEWKLFTNIKRETGASLESRTHSLFYYCCLRPGPGDLKDTVGGVMAKDRMWARHSLAFCLWACRQVIQGLCPCLMCGAISELLVAQLEIASRVSGIV